MSNPLSPHDHLRLARPRRWWRWLLVIALMLAGLAWMTYQHRLTLLINTADRLLQPVGMQVTVLDGIQLSATALQIRQLAIQHSDSGAMQRFANITISFNPATLLSGRVSAITIASVNIQIPDRWAPDRDLSAATSPEPAPYAPLQMADLMAALPFNRLQIDYLDIAASIMTAGDVRAEGLAGSLNAVQVTCQPDWCQFAADLNLTLDRLHYDNAARPIELALMAFSTDAPITASIEATTNTLAVASSSSTLTLPVIRVDDTLTGLVASLQRLRVSQPLPAQGTDPANQYGQAELTVREIATSLVDADLSPMQLNQHLTWEQGAIHATGTLMHRTRRLLHNDLRHDLALGAGQGTLAMPAVAFNDSTGKLSDLWSPLPWQFDVLDGTASAEARLNWQLGDDNAVIAGPVHVNLDDLSGYVNDIAFLRLSADFAVELLPDWQVRSTRAAPVSLVSLDTGIELGNIRSNVRIDSTARSVTLTDASLDLFGGTVSSERLDYHLQDNDSRFTIEIDSIDLSQVLGMSAYRGVSASGLVSGQLPVRLQGLAPSISGGSLSALPPGGTIRYDSGSAAAGSQHLDLVYQALEDYRFNLMEARVNYQDSGELDLAIRMEGISPELNGGQRINLNLNISDDIPALLQSLQAARSVTDTLESRLDNSQ